MTIQREQTLAFGTIATNRELRILPYFTLTADHPPL